MAVSTPILAAQSDASTPISPRARRAMAIWLFVMCGLIALMVMVGGATRLTDSGLSITEWKPVTGALPPTSEAAWAAAFEKYKAIPEYREVNYGMSLDEFKTIYWWEWGHRLLGRIIGAAFLIPFLYFVATGAARGALLWKLGGLFILGGLQGALGWWMVQSGLADRVDVSQYRLAAHLGLAIALFAAMWWLALDLWTERAGAGARRLMLGGLALGLLVYFQIILGAFVAGLRAGYTYNTWPLMDGRFVPRGYFAGAPGLNDLFETIEAVQFNHRIGAYLVVAAAFAFFVWARKSAVAKRAGLVAAIAAAQMSLGVWTLVAGAPIGLGLAHQAGALALLAAALFAAHGAKGGEGILTSGRGALG